MFYYYKYNNKLLFSLYKYPEFSPINIKEAESYSDKIYYLNKFNPLNSRKIFSINDPSLLFIKEEGLHILSKQSYTNDIPNFIINKIQNNQVISINTNYPNWLESIDFVYPDKWRVNLIGLGDVGGTLLIGLKLLGSDCIESIGIYGIQPNNMQRWEYELNQVMPAFEHDTMPTVNIVDTDNLFNCDMFIFCASKSVPEVGSNVKDVRMAQFESNSKIVTEYAKLARKANFKGIFSVVSDPVDLLCKVAFLESNKNSNGEYDFMGLSSDQIRGYGLGVMNARAVYYAPKNSDTKIYLDEGRAFGPHGKDLVIANSIENYDDILSKKLTEHAINANMKVRETGYKPYIAPSLSSGALSIISTIKGDWHYSTTYMGEIFMGAKNRLTKTGTQVEMLNIPDQLMKRLTTTYNNLRDII